MGGGGGAKDRGPSKSQVWVFQDRRSKDTNEDV